MEVVAEKLVEGPFFVKRWGTGVRYDVLIEERIEDSGYPGYYLAVNAAPLSIATSLCNRLNEAVAWWIAGQERLL